MIESLKAKLLESNVKSYRSNYPDLIIREINERLDELQRINQEERECLDKLSRIDWAEEIKPLLTERECICCGLGFIPYLDKAGKCEGCQRGRHGWDGFVSHDLSRARRVGLPATLTGDEWLESIDHFRWKCAYCQSARFTTLEHFVPLHHGGGTTADNCVPSCVECNRKKHRTHPDKIKKVPREDLERVRQYLETRKVAQNV